MSSLAASTTRHSPNTAETDPADPVLAVLSRLRQLLDVDLVSLSRIDGDRLDLLAQSGASAQSTTLEIWQQRAVSSDGPLVVADTNRRTNAAADLGFFAGMVLPMGRGTANLLLCLSDRRARSEAMAHRLTAMAIDVTSRLTITRLTRELTQLRHRRALETRLFERASQKAKIGIWTCDLATEALQWTDGVYDLFELPRGSRLDRGLTLRHYTPASRAAMETARAKAIAECGDFCVDAEITTARGAQRWMRLTGSVEARDGVPMRIFGMKQDITEEKLLADQTRYLAETDVMTGLANRSQFQNRLGEIGQMPLGGLLLVDLDGFKQINDSHGHALGDECLQEAAYRLRQCCEGAELVARIGGDEFAVLVGPAFDAQMIAELGQRIVAAIGQPFSEAGRTIALSASVGVAFSHQENADTLFHEADTALYAAKAAGRNVSRAHARH